MPVISDEQIIKKGWRIDLGDDGDFELGQKEWEYEEEWIGGRKCMVAWLSGKYHHGGTTEDATLEIILSWEDFERHGGDAPLLGEWMDWRIVM